MSHLDRGILGPIHGNLATVNGYSYYGKDFIRSRITSKKDANSPSQLSVRSGFKECSDFLKLFYYTIIAVTFSYFSLRMTNWFFFFKQNLRFFHGSGVIDYDLLFISDGDLLQASSFRSTLFTASRRLFVYWNNNSNGVNAFPTDIMNVFVYNETFNELVIFDNTGVRLTSPLNNYMPLYWGLDDILHVYGYFTTDDKIRIAPNDYALFS